MKKTTSNSEKKKFCPRKLRIGMKSALIIGSQRHVFLLKRDNRDRKIGFTFPQKLRPLSCPTWQKLSQVFGKPVRTEKRLERAKLHQLSRMWFRAVPDVGPLLWHNRCKTGPWTYGRSCYCVAREVLISYRREKQDRKYGMFRTPVTLTLVQKMTTRIEPSSRTLPCQCLWN